MTRTAPLAILLAATIWAACGGDDGGDGDGLVGRAQVSGKKKPRKKDVETKPGRLPQSFAERRRGDPAVPPSPYEPTQRTDHIYGLMVRVTVSL